MIGKPMKREVLCVVDIIYLCLTQFGVRKNVDFSQRQICTARILAPRLRFEHSSNGGYP